MEEKINPIIITDGETGEEYVLEFNREIVLMAEQRGFKRTDAVDKLMTRVPELFYYSFLMHRPTIKKAKTDHILFDELGGISSDVLDRLLELYDLGYESLINESGESKNPHFKISL